MSGAIACQRIAMTAPKFADTSKRLKGLQTQIFIVHLYVRIKVVYLYYFIS